jgi:3-deoxy-7-phosphoheptulonate synthase
MNTIEYLQQACWSPESWGNKPVRQQPIYPSQSDLESVVAEISQLPPLVTPWEVESLKGQLAQAADGDRFVLQGGDCAESFADCTPDGITNKLRILLQMSLVLSQSSGKPVIRIGRFAGQYAKPRSADLETIDGVTLPVYRGDLVNRPEFTCNSRIPDPSRLLRAYERAAVTLNFIRSQVKSALRDLHRREYWKLDFAPGSPRAPEYYRIIRDVQESLRLKGRVLEAAASEPNAVEFFTSHEGLHLAYEQAQTRKAAHRPGWYNLSTHFPWLGVRTCDPRGAHVEYFRGISNPIAVKIGPDTTQERVRELLDTLHPVNEPGRLTFIHRFGRERIGNCLPKLIETVRTSGKKVLWCCDAMHGNTRATADGTKTRRFDDIFGELEQAFDIHAAHGTWLGGIHLELTGDDVTECVGGARQLTEADLARAYRTPVDPRLNYEQALEMALLIAAKMCALKKEKDDRARRDIARSHERRNRPRWTVRSVPAFPPGGSDFGRSGLHMPLS